MAGGVTEFPRSPPSRAEAAERHRLLSAHRPERLQFDDAVGHFRSPTHGVAGAFPFARYRWQVDGQRDIVIHQG